MGGDRTYVKILRVPTVNKLWKQHLRYQDGDKRGTDVRNVKVAPKLLWVGNEYESRVGRGWTL